MKRLQGFTLIELMIVVAVAGILAAIAYPSYIQHVIKSNRSAAEGFLLSVANRQEQYILDARQYAGVAADPGDSTGLTTLNMTVPTTVSNNYAIKIGAITSSPPYYKITAVPIGTQLARDTQCGSVSIDQTGTKRSTGSVSSCW